MISHNNAGGPKKPSSVSEISRRQLLRDVGFAAGGISLAGCTGNSGQNNSNSGGQETGTQNTGKKNTLRAALAGSVNIRTLDPPNVALDTTMQVIYMMFEGLTTYDNKMEVKPQLATDWKRLNPTSVRFNLKKGVKFHNGKNMTAEDVKYSLERFSSPDVKKSSYWEALKSVEIKNRHTVIVHTKRPFSPLLPFLTGNSRSGGQIFPKGSGDGKFGKNPIGTGPFKLEKWENKSSLNFSKFEKYHINNKPHLSRVEMPLIPEESTAVSSLQSGNVDMISVVPSQSVSTLKKDPNIELGSIEGSLAFRVISFNNTREPFTDPKVRLAFAKSFRNKDIIKTVMLGQAVVAKGPIPSSHAMYTDLPYHQKYDPKAAKKLIKQSKYSLSELQKENLEILTWGSGFWYQYSKIVSQQLNDNLGLNVKVNSISYENAFTKADNLSYDMLSWGWQGLAAADSYVYQYRKDASRNYRGSNNKELNKLLDKSRRTFNNDKLKNIYKKSQNIIAKTAMDAFIYYPTLIVPWSIKVKGYKVSPQNEYGGQFIDVHKTN